jgi:hypothetical protein
MLRKCRVFFWHPFLRRGVLRSVQQSREQPVMKAPLRIAPEYLSLFMTGKRPRPALGADMEQQSGPSSCLGVG